jgi:colanic acid/amylovoran biosynthesis glycosyltransferase
MLKEKVKSAKFVRCISEHGKNELLEIIGGNYREKIKVIHMGVKVPIDVSESEEPKSLFTIVTPANLLEVKGHKYLIEACLNLVRQGIKNFQCFFYGNGPMRVKLESLIREKKLINFVKMPGVLPHEKLIKLYKNKEIDVVVLPSITTKTEHEGIPVSLMEAMAYGIPVISTNTGGIPELLSGGVGIIVEEKSPEQLAEAILKIMKNKDLRKELAERGLQRIKEDFNIEKNTKILLKLIQELS